MATDTLRLPVDTRDGEGHFRNVQSRAERIFRAFDDSAPVYVSGETLVDYRRRLCNKLKQFSQRWKYADIGAFPVGPTLDLAEEQIYSDAVQAINDPSRVPAGQLLEITETDRTGRHFSRFIGDPEATWSPFKSPVRRLISTVADR
jgi:hypothetical protein